MIRAWSLRERCSPPAQPSRGRVSGPAARVGQVQLAAILVIVMIVVVGLVVVGAIIAAIALAMRSGKVQFEELPAQRHPDYPPHPQNTGNTQNTGTTQNTSSPQES